MNTSPLPVLPRRLLCAAAAMALVALLVACSKDDGGFQPAVRPGPDAKSAASDAPEVVVVPETAPMEGDPDYDVASEEEKKARAEADAAAQGLLDSFKARVYDPVRDSRLISVSAVATVRYDDKTATFRVTYDGAIEDVNARISVLAVDGVDAMPANMLKQVRRFAAFGLHGAYASVVYHRPPIEHWLTLTEKEPHDYVVTAPVFRTDLSVSYQFDERQLIVTRGALFEGRKEVSNYTYENYRGRYLVQERLTVGTGTRVEYDYREDDGMILLTEAKLHQNAKTLTVSFEYADLRREAP